MVKKYKEWRKRRKITKKKVQIFKKTMKCSKHMFFFNFKRHKLVHDTFFNVYLIKRNYLKGRKHKKVKTKHEKTNKKRRRNSYFHFDFFLLLISIIFFLFFLSFFFQKNPRCFYQFLRKFHRLNVYA